MNVKSIFKSKTALVALITASAGAVGSVVPSVGEVIQANAGTILLGLGALNIALRFATKGRVVLFPE